MVKYFLISRECRFIPQNYSYWSLPYPHVAPKTSLSLQQLPIIGIGRNDQAVLIWSMEPHFPSFSLVCWLNLLQYKLGVFDHLLFFAKTCVHKTSELCRLRLKFPYPENWCHLMRKLGPEILGKVCALAIQGLPDYLSPPSLSQTHALSLTL